MFFGYVESGFFGWDGVGDTGAPSVGLCVDGSAVCFSEFFWSVAGSLAEVVAEGGRVPETAGEGCFCDGAGGGAEKLGGHLEAVFQEILFWGYVFVFHEDPVKVGAVDSHVACNV